MYSIYGHYIHLQQIKRSYYYIARTRNAINSPAIMLQGIMSGSHPSYLDATRRSTKYNPIKTLDRRAQIIPVRSLESLPSSVLNIRKIAPKQTTQQIIVRIGILSFNNINPKIAENIGLDALMTRTLATAVR